MCGLSKHMLGLDPKMAAGLKGVFKLSEGAGRYKQHDLGIFSKEQLNSVEGFGYEI